MGPRHCAMRLGEAHRHARASPNPVTPPCARLLSMVQTNAMPDALDPKLEAFFRKPLRYADSPKPRSLDAYRAHPDHPLVLWAYVNYHLHDGYRWDIGEKKKDTELLRTAAQAGLEVADKTDELGLGRALRRVCNLALAYLLLERKPSEADLSAAGSYLSALESLKDDSAEPFEEKDLGGHFERLGARLQVLAGAREGARGTERGVPATRAALSHILSRMGARSTGRAARLPGLGARRARPPATHTARQTQRLRRLQARALGADAAAQGDAQHPHRPPPSLR